MTEVRKIEGQIQCSAGILPAPENAAKMAALRRVSRHGILCTSVGGDWLQGDPLTRLRAEAQDLSRFPVSLRRAKARLRRLTDWRNRRLRSTLSPKGAREVNSNYLSPRPLGGEGPGAFAREPAQRAKDRSPWRKPWVNWHATAPEPRKGRKKSRLELAGGVFSSSLVSKTDVVRLGMKCSTRAR
jgi:hypothetical protein